MPGQAPHPVIFFFFFLANGLTFLSFGFLFSDVNGLNQLLLKVAPYSGILS